MKLLDYLSLFVIQFTVLLFVAHYQIIPGNLDADYYFVTGMQIAQGKGFTEPFIWNYLNDPTGIPQPSHSYWSPLASIITALGMLLLQSQTYSASRTLFIVIAACVPFLTSALAYRFTKRRDLAYVSGFLAIFSALYIPYLPITENYGIVMMLGALYFLWMDRTDPWWIFFLGVLSGLMSLARNDGLIWLAVIFLLIWRNQYWKNVPPILSKSAMGVPLADIFLALSGFFLIMGPWYFRNIITFGAPISDSARHVFWVTNYYETFVYPSSQLTYSAWIERGWQEILRVRWWSLQRNLLTAFVVQGGIVLWPFIIIGVVKMWKDFHIQVGALAWMALFFMATFVFGVIGARGEFFHTGSALQPLWWVMASIGLDASAVYLQKYKLFARVNLVPLFQYLLIEVVLTFSVISVWTNIFASGWQKGELEYPQAEQFLLQRGIQPNEPVMVLNPPGYFMMTARPAIMLPFGDENSILSVSKRYNVRYIVLELDNDEENHYTPLYSYPNLYRNILFIGEISHMKIFEVQGNK